MAVERLAGDDGGAHGHRGVGACAGDGGGGGSGGIVASAMVIGGQIRDPGGCLAS